MNPEQIAAFAAEAAQIVATKTQATENVIAADALLAKNQAADQAARFAAHRARIDHDQAMAELKTRMQAALVRYSESAWQEYLPRLVAARNSYAAILRQGVALCEAVGIVPDPAGAQHGPGTLLMVPVAPGSWRQDPDAVKVFTAHSAPRLALEAVKGESK